MSKGWYFKSGDWNIHCDVCGKKIKASESKQRWDGFRVCEEDWETRHPMDFIRARADKISVPFTRPTEDMSIYIYCTVFNSVAISNQGVAGCMVAGRNSIHG